MSHTLAWSGVESKANHSYAVGVQCLYCIVAYVVAMYMITLQVTHPMTGYLRQHLQTHVQLLIINYPPPLAFKPNPT